ncbi:MAG: hypothetical protein Q4G27_03610 [Flavobacteriaceae bacterium]|nr:hypothetical protein [Flavobacteriaceae bacterium]
MRIIFIFCLLISFGYGQDLTGRWVAVTGFDSGYYAELFLVQNLGNSYAGHSYDTEAGGYCRHFLQAEFDVQRQFLSGIDVELNHKSTGHEATDYQLRYEKGENGREYLIGTTTITPLNNRRNPSQSSPFDRLENRLQMLLYPPKFIKYVKVSPEYQVYRDEMPNSMSWQEIELAKAEFDEVYEENLALEQNNKNELYPFEIEEDITSHIPKEEEIEISRSSIENIENEEITSISKTEEMSIEEKKVLRTNQLLSHIQLKTSSVTLLIRDYGTVDNDTVTIFFNDKIIAENLRITDVAHEFELILEGGKRNELVFVANNLGDIPPNTARITLIADNRRYNYKLFTDDKNNALVLLENILSY